MGRSPPLPSRGTAAWRRRRPSSRCRSSPGEQIHRASAPVRARRPIPRAIWGGHRRHGNSHPQRGQTQAPRRRAGTNRVGTGTFPRATLQGELCHSGKRTTRTSLYERQSDPRDQNRHTWGRTHNRPCRTHQSPVCRGCRSSTLRSQHQVSTGEVRRGADMGFQSAPNQHGSQHRSTKTCPISAIRTAPLPSLWGRRQGRNSRPWRPGAHDPPELWCPTTYDPDLRLPTVWRHENVPALAWKWCTWPPQHPPRPRPVP